MDLPSWGLSPSHILPHVSSCLVAQGGSHGKGEKRGTGSWYVTHICTSTGLQEFIQDHGEQHQQPSTHTVRSPGGVSPEDAGSRGHGSADSVFPLCPGCWTVGKSGQRERLAQGLTVRRTLFFIFYFWPHCMACGFLDPQPGITPMPRAVKVWSPNCWTTREVLRVKVFKSDRIGIRIRGPGRVR